VEARAAVAIVQSRRVLPLNYDDFVILSVTEGGARDLLYLPFNTGA
jgi:hypothetical protein